MKYEKKHRPMLDYLVEWSEQPGAQKRKEYFWAITVIVIMLCVGRLI